jgi:hypothetical protein
MVTKRTPGRSSRGKENETAKYRGLRNDNRCSIFRLSAYGFGLDDVTAGKSIVMIRQQD